MSEYQYYEFQAIDRALSEKEMAELRSYSTRAELLVVEICDERLALRDGLEDMPDANLPEPWLRRDSPPLKKFRL
jgi:hypothetical protein